MKVLFFGDGIWAALSLEVLLKIVPNVVAVVTRTKPTDDSLYKLAKNAGIPLFQPDKVNHPDFLEKVLDMAPDLNVSVSYDQIIRKPLLDSAPRGFLNFHAGNLPYYRGRSVINWAIINGESEIGITAHFMDEGIDTGDILLQRTIPVAWSDTYGDVLDTIVAAIPPLVEDSVKMILEERVQRIPQSHLQGTYFPVRGLGDEELNWLDTSVNLYNKVRAITVPGPGAKTSIDGKVVTIWEAFYDKDWPNYIATAGQVVGVNKGIGSLVKTGDSTILITRAQNENSDEMVPHWRIGTRLESTT